MNNQYLLCVGKRELIPHRIYPPSSTQLTRSLKYLQENKIKVAGGWWRVVVVLACD